MNPIDNPDIPMEMLEKLAQGVRSKLPAEAAEVDREIALRRAAAPRAEEVRTTAPVVRTAVLLMPCGHPTTDLRESGNPEGFCLGCARVEDLMLVLVNRMTSPGDDDLPGIRKALVKWEQMLRGLIATPSPTETSLSAQEAERSRAYLREQSCPAAAPPCQPAESLAP